MKMRKNFIILSGICALLLIVSCKSFIAEDNKSNINADSYYKTQVGYESLMNSLYAQLRSLYGRNYDVWMYCGGTDIFWRGVTGNTDAQGLSSYANLTPANGFVTQYYDSTYHAIQVANTAIYYNSKTASAPTLKSRLGEARLLRALFYFNLVRFFGGVALTTNMINKPVLSFKRSPADSVYTFVIDQMKQALNEVPESNDPGRVDKRTVRFYLAKAYLTYGWWLTNPYNIQLTSPRKDPNGHNANYYFQQAAKYADATINGQPLSMSFAQEWNPKTTNNPDVIFSVQYSAASLIDPKNDGNDQNYFFSPYLGGEGAVNGYPYRSHTLFPDPFLFSLFTKYDARMQASFMLTRYEHYYDYFGNSSKDTVTYYYVPTWDASNVTAWKNADPSQRANAIVVPEQDWAPNLVGQPNYVPPPVKKFDDPNAPFAQYGNTRNIVLARLADAYLVAAEAYYKSGDAATAAQRINVVRERAAKPGDQSHMTITPSQVSIDFILNERARELLGEYHRWFDLKRTGMLIKRVEQNNRNVQLWLNQGIDPFKGTDGQYKLLRPIPQAAIDLNHATVKQNPGY